jgi:hypothetical protein
MVMIHVPQINGLTHHLNAYDPYYAYNSQACAPRHFRLFTGVLLHQSSYMNTCRFLLGSCYIPTPSRHIF